MLIDFGQIFSEEIFNTKKVKSLTTEMKENHLEISEISNEIQLLQQKLQKKLGRNSNVGILPRVIHKLRQQCISCLSAFPHLSS